MALHGRRIEELQHHQHSQARHSSAGAEVVLVTTNGTVRIAALPTCVYANCFSVR